MCNDPECPYGALLDVAGEGEDLEGTVLMQVHGYDIAAPWEGAAHIARQDPATTLARIAAERAILRDYLYRAERADESLITSAHATGLLLALRHIASGYANRPGYREEWQEG